MTSMKRISLIGSAFRAEARPGPSARGLNPRSFRLALLAIVLVGMAFWSTPADAVEPAGPVWSADMTVVEYSSVSIGAASADLFSNVGGSGNLRIKSLWSYMPGRDLRLAFEEVVPNAADYTLWAGGLSLEFPADSSGASSFKWNDVDVDWEDGQIIHVRIVPTAESGAQPANTPATGVPTISGTAQVGETLAADTSSVADADGLANVSYAYQWIRTDGGTDADIADATESTHTLTGDDQGKTIKLKVTFNDDRGNSETLTSAATADVGKGEQKPQFLVSNLGAGVGGASGIQRPLNAARSGFAQAFTTGAKTGGYAPGSVGIQVSHFFDASTVGDHLRVTINGVTVNGVASEGEPGDAHCTLTNPSSFSTPGVIAFEAPAGAGSCPQLAAGTTYFVVIEWVDPSGTGSFALIPQTYPTAESAATGEDPGGAEGWSIADESHYLAVGSDSRTWTAYDETASFKIEVKEAAVTTAKANSPATAVPIISGTAQVGETLTADTSGIADADGLDDVSYSYQWIRSDNGADTDIAGAADSAYTVVLADQAKTIKVKVSFTDDADNAESLTSAATEAVAAKPNTAPTGLPTVSGTPQVGETLTADTSAIEDADGLSGVSYSYQWIAGGTDVDGATGSSSLLTSSEQGQAIQVRVTFTDDAENQETVTSEATAAVAARPNTPATGAPAIAGTAQVDETLTSDTSGIADADGLTNATFSYQWVRNGGTGDADIAGATSSTYTPSDEDVGETIKVRVSFADDAGNEETLTSAPTEEVTAAGPAPVPLTVSVTAAAPTTHDGTTAFTFEIRFSEEPEPDFSYRTLKFHAFAVTGGEILKAQRMDKPSNIRWRITVRPDSDAVVSITLPATGDCGETGAICTEDGRMLSNELVLTVDGQDGTPPASSAYDTIVVVDEDDDASDSPKTDDVDPTPTPTPEQLLWSATMTVGAGGDYEVGYYVGSPLYPGHGLNGPMGSLSASSTFTVGADDYAVVRLTYFYHLSAVALIVSGTGPTGLPFDFALTVGEATFLSSDATGTSGEGFYGWAYVQPGWAAGDELPVSLTYTGGTGLQGTTPQPQPASEPDPASLAPSNLTAEIVNGEVHLGWDAPAADAGSVTSYEVERFFEPEPGITLLQTISTGSADTVWRDRGAFAAGTTYTYRVRAERGAQASEPSGAVAAVIPVPLAMLAPSGLSATAIDGGGVSLSWTAPAAEAGTVTG